MLSRSINLNRYLVIAPALWHNLRLSSCVTLRSFSSSSAQENVQIKDTDRPVSESVGYESHTDATAFTQFVEPTPIQSLNIAANIEKMQKHGSLFSRYYCGACDPDLLNYPFLLKSRTEFLQMNEQYEMIRNTFNKIDKSEETLNQLGFNSLHKLSISEMMFIFEAIGASIQKQFAFGTREGKEIRYEKKMSKSFKTSLERPFKISEMAYKCFNDTQSTMETVMPLIVRNALVNYAISRTSNPNLQELLSNQKLKIGFAFDEPLLRQSSKYSNWKTEAKLSSDFQSWFVSGEKSNILKGDYSHYLLFCKTETFVDQQPFTVKHQNEGYVVVLIPANEVEVYDDGSDYCGLEYQKIKFQDVKLPRETTEVIKGQKDICELVNLKGCGQLASSALTLGMLKQLLKNTYAHLLNEKLGLTNCELVQYKLYQATSKIYALESMLYMTAAMFDSFEAGVNLEGECVTVKTLATEYGSNICQELRGIYGSRHPFSSTTLEMIYSLDAFLDSSLSNRILLGDNAVSHFKLFNELKPGIFKQHVTASIYSLTRYLKYRKARRGIKMHTNSLTKFAHHNLHIACNWVEGCINRLEYATYLVANLNKTDHSLKHQDLNRLATLGMDVFMMIAVLSRANHAVCYGLRNGNMEKELCLAICKETFIKHLEMFENTSKDSDIDNDILVIDLFEQNRKENGYFAPLFQTPEAENTNWAI